MKKALIALLLLTSSLVIYFYVRLTNTNDRYRVIASTTNAEIEHSNFILRDRCDFTYQNVQNQLADPSNHFEAARWAWKVSDIRSLSKAIYRYIDSLKMRQKQDKDQWSVYNSGEGSKLFDNLVNYKIAYLGTFDSLPSVSDMVVKDMKEMKAQSEKRILPVLRENRSSDWVEYNFKGISTEGTILRLSEIQSEILRAEMGGAEYFSKQIGDRRGDIIFESYSFAGLKSEVLRIGHTVEAYVHFFNMNYYGTKPEIRINGLEMAIVKDNEVVYFEKATTVGKHELKVTVKYLLPDSTQSVITKWLDYEVVP